MKSGLMQLFPTIMFRFRQTDIEPSAILTLRDEYLDLATDKNKESAKRIAENTFTIEEFIAHHATLGNIHSSQFTSDKKQIALHGHCYQKTLSSQHFI